MMKRNKIYMLNETLLDEVDVDEVHEKNGSFKIVLSLNVGESKKDEILSVLNNIFDSFVEGKYIERYNIELNDSRFRNGSGIDIVIFLYNDRVDIDLFNSIMFKTLAVVFDSCGLIFRMRVTEVDDRVYNDDALSVECSFYATRVLLMNLNIYAELFPDISMNDVYFSIGSIMSKYGLCDCLEPRNKIYRFCVYHERDKNLVKWGKRLVVNKDGKVIYKELVRLGESGLTKNVFCCGLLKVFSNENKGWNFIDIDGNYISNEFFSSASDFSPYDQVAVVTFNDQSMGLMNTKGEIITEDRYQDIDVFSHDGYFVVENYDGEYNYIDTCGKVLSPNKWFSKVTHFDSGYAIVVDDEGRGIIDTSGNILFHTEESDVRIVSVTEDVFILRRNESNGGLPTQETYITKDGTYLPGNDEWVDKCRGFLNGYGLIENQREMTFINKTGNYVCERNGRPVWFKNCSFFDEDGIAKVIISDFSGDYENFIDTNGKYISPEHFERYWGVNLDGSSSFNDGLAPVCKKYGNDMKHNFFRKDGTFLMDEWFDGIECVFSGGYAVIKIDGKSCCVDTSGKILFRKKIQIESKFVNGLACVKNAKGEFNYIGIDGKSISKTWFFRVGRFYGGACEVCLAVNRKKDEIANFIDRNGNLILKEWLESDYANNITIYGDCHIIKKGNGYNLITADGKLLSESWRPYKIKYIKDKDLFEIGYGVMVDKTGTLVNYI